MYTILQTCEKNCLVDIISKYAMLSETPTPRREADDVLVCVRDEVNFVKQLPPEINAKWLSFEGVHHPKLNSS